jgi:endonuclease-3
VTLEEVVRRLREHYGPPDAPPTTDPFELILLENVAYLASPERRLEAFTLLKTTVGTRPAAILAAKPQTLERVTARGILKARFAAKLEECARIAVQHFDGALDPVVRGPADAAKKALRKFPGIGEPGSREDPDVHREACLPGTGIEWPPRARPGRTDRRGAVVRGDLCGRTVGRRRPPC